MKRTNNIMDASTVLPDGTTIVATENTTRTIEEELKPGNDYLDAVSSASNPSKHVGELWNRSKHILNNTVTTTAAKTTTTLGTSSGIAINESVAYNRRTLVASFYTSKYVLSALELISGLRKHAPGTQLHLRCVSKSKILPKNALHPCRVLAKANKACGRDLHTMMVIDSLRHCIKNNFTQLLWIDATSLVVSQVKVPDLGDQDILFAHETANPLSGVNIGVGLMRCNTRVLDFHDAISRYSRIFGGWDQGDVNIALGTGNITRYVTEYHKKRLRFVQPMHGLKWRFLPLSFAQVVKEARAIGGRRPAIMKYIGKRYSYKKMVLKHSLGNLLERSLFRILPRYLKKAADDGLSCREAKARITYSNYPLVF